MSYKLMHSLYCGGYLRNIPPPSICPTGSRPKATLPKQATRVLRAWLEKNPRPYPTREDKEALAACTGLTVMQVSVIVCFVLAVYDEWEQLQNTRN